MALEPIVITLTGENSDAQQSIQETTDQIKEMGDAGEDAAEGLDAATSSAKDLSEQLEGVAGKFQVVGEDVPGAEIFESLIEGVGGIGEKIADVKAAMDELRDAGDGGPQGVDVGLLDQGAESAAALSEQLEGVRNKGLAVAAISAGGIALSKSLQETYEEGAAVEQRLESILKAQNRLDDLDAQNDVIQNVTVKGHFDDDDEIRNGAVLLDSFNVKTEHMGELLEDAARRARTMGTDVSSVAEQLGKAYNTGAVANLAKSGVTLDPADIEKINQAYARSAAEGQALFIQIVGAAIRDNTVDLSDSLTATQAQANDAARALDDAMTAAGEGASEAQANIDGLKNSLITMVSVNPEIAKGAGSILTYGSYALAAGGSLVAFGAQLGQLFLGYQALQAAKAAKALADAGETVTTTANTAATAANTAAQTGNAAATTANTGAQATNAGIVATAAGAALADAVAQDVLAVAEGGAAVAAEAEAVAVTGGAAATGVAAVAAGVGAVGFGALAAAAWTVVAPFAAIIGVATAAAAAIALAAYSWNENKDAILNPTSSTEDNRTDEQKTQDSQTEGQLDQMRGSAEKLQGKDKYATLNALAQKYLDLNQTDKAAELQSEAAEARKGLKGSSKELQMADSAEGKALLAQIQGQKADANKSAQLDGSNFHGYQKHDFWGNVTQDSPSASSGTPDASALKAQADAAIAQAKQGGAPITAPSVPSASGRSSVADSPRTEQKEQTQAARDAEMLASIQRESAANARQDVLEDELEAARKDKNTARVRALTLQIETAKAQKAREDELAKAALEDDKAHRAALEKAAQLHYEGAIDAARRAADKSAASMRDDKSGGKDDGEGDRRTRALLSMRNVRVGAPIQMGGGALGEGAYSAPMFQMPQPTRRQNASGAGSYPMDSSGMARVGDPAIQQGADGKLTVVFPNLEVPLRELGLSVGALRGRARR